MVHTSDEASRVRSRASEQSASGQPSSTSAIFTQARPQSHDASCRCLGIATDSVCTDAAASLGERPALVMPAAFAGYYIEELGVFLGKQGGFWSKVVTLFHRQVVPKDLTFNPLGLAI